MRSVELFAGCGGLALGLSQAGFEHDAVVEWDEHACRTLIANRARGVRFVKDWPVWQADVREFKFGSIAPQPDLLSGGVPCQPFSLGGKHRGHLDTRNMFPAFVEAIRQLRPRVVLVENVKGLLRESFRPYLDYVLRQIAEPELAQNADETWQEHDRRLLSHKPHVGSARLSYAVTMDLLNAADYGAPQRRERVFIVGVRSDIDAVWGFPKPTHSHAALQFDQFVTGEYWQRHAMPACPCHESTSLRLVPGTLPWVTVRDVISDLPAFGSADAKHAHHLLMPGAKVYPGHTGSRLDLPAKTLKAGDHGVPGGENMVVLGDGSVRYVSVREAARIQTFPDDYVFEGSWSEIMRQIGNAVPVELAFALGSKLSGILGCSGSMPEEALAIGAGAI